jgi:serine/threonine protein kinase
MPTGEGYSKAVDSWSVGVMTCYLLTATNPFTNNDLEDTESAVVRNNGEVGLSNHFYDSIAPKIGLRPADFIKRLCELDETARLGIEGALEHPWFTNDATILDLNRLYEKITTDWSPRNDNTLIHDKIPDIYSSLPTKNYTSKKAKTSLEFPNYSTSPLIIPDSQSSGSEPYQSHEQEFRRLIKQDLVEMGTQWDLDEPSIPRPGDDSCTYHRPITMKDADSIESASNNALTPQENRTYSLWSERPKWSRVAKTHALNRTYEYKPVIVHAFKRSKLSRYEARWPGATDGDGFW